MQFVPRDELSTRFDDLDAKMFRMAQVGNALGAPLLTAVALVVGAHAVDCHGHCDPSAANLCTPPASALRRRFDPMTLLSHCTALHCTHCTALHCTAPNERAGSAVSAVQPFNSDCRWLCVQRAVAARCVAHGWVGVWPQYGSACHRIRSGSEWSVSRQHL